MSCLFEPIHGRFPTHSICDLHPDCVGCSYSDKEKPKTFCDTCGHQFSDICGNCESLDGVPIKYSEKPKASTLPDELTPYAVELITKCPQLINLFAEKINRMINNFEPSDPDHTEALEPIDISHVGYSMEQCGYDK